MSPSEHVTVTIVTAIPAIILAIATLWGVIATARKVKAIEKNTNGPVADLLKKTAELVRQLNGEPPPPPPAPPEKTEHFDAGQSE